MKQLKFLLIFILLLLPVSVAFAETADITLKADGKVLETDVPPIIVNDRTLVPVRVVSESSGADVEWNSEKRLVTITTDKTEIKLEIDSSEATVNDKTVNLDAPAQIVSDRTMVPVRFVAEAFGYTVEWDGETRTVDLISPPPEKEETPPEKDDTEDEDEIQTAKKTVLKTIGAVNTDKGYRVTIKFNSEVSEDYKIFVLNNPDRLIVDFSNAQVDYTTQYDFSNETITKARVGNHDNYMRVVIDMKEETDYETYFSSKKDALVIFFDAESDEPEIKDEITTEEPDDEDDEKSEEEYEIKKPESLEDLIVVIDAGHGGSDPGALGKVDGEIVARESEINLAVALKVREYLEDEGITVIMTRDDDDRISLGDRCVISNTKKAHLFVSIHSNAMEPGNEHINGSMVFFGKSKDKEGSWVSSKKLAQNILENLCDSMDTQNLDIQNGDQLAVIRGTIAPAVLVELAFITNEDDRDKLTSKKYQKKAAKGIVQGILDSIDLE